MRKFFAVFCVTALAAAILLPGSAFAAGKRYHKGYVRAAPVYHERVAVAPRPAYDAYAQAPVYTSGVAANPLLFPVGGALIGAAIGAAVCPPCSIAGTALTAGSGALVGAGIGAIGGTVVGAAVSQPPMRERYY